jgi:endonuclease YncB( thermonuclease family)
MKFRGTFCLSAVLSAALLAFGICTAQAEVLEGRVVAVTDGDTITVLDLKNKQHKIHLSGIGAPEKEQPFGNQSKQHLSDLLYDKSVTVTWKKYDRYGRIVGKVMVAAPDSCPPMQPVCPKNLDAGLEQITAGLAWYYRQFAKEQTEEDRERYVFAELEAKAKHVGLWQDKNPIPPWDWRRLNPR